MLETTGQSAGQVDAGKGVACLAVVAIVAMVSLACCILKTGYFMDEFYTFGLSNSTEGPFLSYYRDGSWTNVNWTDATFTQEELHNYLTVQEDERFDYASVWYNQSEDVHPPLYYLIFHTASSLVPDTFSKWIGLVPNLILHLLTVAVLFAMALRVFCRDVRCAVLVSLLWGLSAAGLSDMLMLRMYILETFLSVCFAYFACQYLRLQKAPYCLGLAVFFFLGLMTQLLFVVFAGLCCLFLGIYLLSRRAWGPALLLVAGVVGPLVAFIIVWPTTLATLTDTSTVSGGSMLEHLRDVASWPRRFELFGEGLATGMVGTLILSALGVVAVGVRAIFIRVRGPQQVREAAQTSAQDIRMLHLFPVVVLVPALLAFIITAISAPWESLRYVYNVMPFFAFVPGYLLYALHLPTDKGRLLWLYACACLVAGLVASLVVFKPSWIADGNAFQLKQVEEYAASPCVVMNKNRDSGVTKNLEELLVFDDFFIAADAASPALADYVENHAAHDRLVLFTDSKHSSIEADPAQQASEVAEKEGYGKVSPLYTRDTVYVWVLSEPVAVKAAE